MSDVRTFDFAAFRASLHKLAHPNTESPDARKLTQEVIKTSLNYIKDIVGVSKIEIATVRERSGYRKQRLRHVYASPENIRAYFDMKDSGHEGITSHAFEDPSAKLKNPSADAGSTEVDNIYYTLYDIKKNQVVRYDPAATRRGQYIFPDRIDTFLATITSDENYIEGISFGKISNCLVLGLTKSKRQKGKDDWSASIDSMVALYFTCKGKTNNLKEKILICTHFVAEMFRTVEEIRVRDRTNFEREALKDIVGLVPIFDDKTVSPSDAVAALLKTFTKIFKKHEYFGPGRYHREPKKRTRQHQWVTFLSIAYRGYDDERKMPVLAVYPKSEAKNNYVQCYRVSDPDHPSISKYLLYRYLQQSGEPTPKVFPKEFSDVNVPQNAFLPARKSAPPKGLVLTSNDRDAWEKLNLDIIREGTTNTTAAFLLCRQAHGETRPFAVLAFESDYADAFSHPDIELISRLVDASASLLSYIKLGSHSIDYSERLKEAFGGIVIQPIGDVPYWKIVYELLRLDHLAAKKILECKDERLWRKSSLVQRKVRERVLKIVRMLDDDNLADDQVALYRWLRSQNTVELIDENWSDNIQDIHKFLVAVPANDIWYCYLGSIARALSGRRFQVSKPPIFTQFHPGYSALAMFIVNAEFQTAQIAKLTTKDKLRLEETNYREFVRYKIPLAARIPANGIAFDTLGFTQEKKATRNFRDIGYGVVVSDLITGVRDLNTPTPMSFLSLCADLMNEDSNEGKRQALAIAEAIEHHFTENIKIWIVEGGQDWGKQDSDKREKSKVAALIERLTGTGAKKDLYAIESSQVNIDKRLENIKNSLPEIPDLPNAILRMLNATCQYFERYVKHSSADGNDIDFGPFSSMNDLVQELKKRRPNQAGDGEHADMHDPHHFKPSYVHGDMNGNNLTWAANYNRFVMIDFENIQLGFVGVDQLKLLASMICETVMTARRLRRERTGSSVIDNQAVRDIEHYNMISLVKLVPWLISKVIQVGDRPKHKRAETLKELSVKAKEAKASLLEVALAIIRTIEFDKLDLPTSNEQLFWRWTLRNLFYRQFEYAYRDIDTRHIDALEAVRKSIDKVINSTDKASKENVDAITFLTETSPNVLESANNNNVIMLFYAFLTLLTTLKREE